MSVFQEELWLVASRHAERVAVEDDAGRLSYGALFDRAAAVAAELGRRGLAGARVGLLARAGTPWIEAFLGVLAAGGTVVALSPLYPDAELAPLVEAAGPAALLVSSDLQEVASRIAGSRPVLDVESLVGVGGAPPAGFVPSRDDDVALVLFTSGTTGRPKAARLTHENVRYLARTLGAAWGFGPTDVLLHVLPLHHLHGIGVSLVVSLCSGAATRFLPRFVAEDAWEALAECTVLMGVPTQHKKLFDAFDAEDPVVRARWTTTARRLRLVTSGSAALPETVGARWRALTGRYPLERYGMTEIGIVLSNPLDGERRPGTVGQPLEGTELRIVVDTGGEAEPDEPGEIWVRGPTVFDGYDRDPAATDGSFTDGWFRTGDTASRSPDGYVKILGRTSVDILKSGGYKLSALEIEEALRVHPDVADAAVVGVPDETWGDRVVAVVVPRPGRAHSLSEDSLRTWARGRLAAYKVPKRIAFMDELPRNALGKITKSHLVSAMLRLE